MEPDIKIGDYGLIVNESWTKQYLISTVKRITPTGMIILENDAKFPKTLYKSRGINDSRLLFGKDAIEEINKYILEEDTEAKNKINNLEREILTVKASYEKSVNVLHNWIDKFTKENKDE